MVTLSGYGCCVAAFASLGRSAHVSSFVEIRFPSTFATVQEMCISEVPEYNLLLRNEFLATTVDPSLGIE